MHHPRPEKRLGGLRQWTRRLLARGGSIREGASVRERQAIITIPDMTRMAVDVKIHETYIKKVRKGQKARVTVDAFPDKVLTGEVTKSACCPIHRIAG
jgi:hypothetical protein